MTLAILKGRNMKHETWVGMGIMLVHVQTITSCVSPYDIIAVGQVQLGRQFP